MRLSFRLQCAQSPDGALRSSCPGAPHSQLVTCRITDCCLCRPGMYGQRSPAFSSAPQIHYLLIRCCDTTPVSSLHEDTDQQLQCPFHPVVAPPISAPAHTPGAAHLATPPAREPHAGACRRHVLLLPTCARARGRAELNDESCFGAETRHSTRRGHASRVAFSHGFEEVRMIWCSNRLS